MRSGVAYAGRTGSTWKRNGGRAILREATVVNLSKKGVRIEFSQPKNSTSAKTKMTVKDYDKLAII